MTKKHFEALAKRLRLIIAPKVRLAAAQAIADVGSSFNPLFNRSRFYEACDVARFVGVHGYDEETP